MSTVESQTIDHLGDLLPYYELDIDISDALSTKLDLFQLHKSLDGHPIAIWEYKHTELEQIYSREWLEYMCSIGLQIGNTLIFYRNPHYLNPVVHIDTYANASVNHYAVNFVLDPNDDSDMIWYSYPPGMTHLPPLTYTHTRMHYIGWDLGSYTGQELHRYTIGRRMTLVNTSMPHTIETRSRPRWSISTRFYRVLNKEANQNWQQAVNDFQPYLRKKT